MGRARSTPAGERPGTTSSWARRPRARPRPTSRTSTASPGRPAPPGTSRPLVLYPPPCVGAGDPRPRILPVGTYTQAHAFADLHRAAKRTNSVSVTIGNGGLVVFNSKRPTSVYFAYPGKNYQVEVFAPS